VSYHVHETFYSLQGEGARTGRPAVFCRFAGCNLWNGLESSRASAQCTFCDTQFMGTKGDGGGVFERAEDLARYLRALLPSEHAVRARPYVVCTGGEPLLQLDSPLIQALHGEGFEIAIETNGTLACPPGIDWICVSPKAGAPWVLREGHELKIVWPQSDFDLAALEQLPFEYFFLQPCDDRHAADNQRAAMQMCLEHPRWRLSLQTHKLLQIR
jgi:7-carboxy-7-deazaguanine synthase (Cx14CxxC type)